MILSTSLSSDFMTKILFLLTFSLIVSIHFLSCQTSEKKAPLDLRKSSNESFSDSSKSTGSNSEGMKSVDAMTEEEREDYKEQLHKQGRYECCIKPTCTMCLYDATECPCGKSIKTDDPVCGECFRGWQKGKGSIKGINPLQVKRM